MTSRRQFLIGTGATAATGAVVGSALLAGCSSDSNGSATPSTTTRPSVAPPVAKNQPELKSDPFTLGVAAGDPDQKSLVIWTRLAPDALAADGSGGMPDKSVELIWEMADEADFKNLRAAGVVEVEAEHAHSAHVVVDGLDAGKWVHYRFRYGKWTSSVGRARTMPSGSPESFRIAVANCQMFEAGHYAAYRHMLAEKPDLVVHLGDYIYEYPFKALKDRVVQPDHYLKDLADFRNRYACYKQDKDLQAMHANATFILTWDDHEVANNYMGDIVPGSGPERGQERKTMAYKAWWEHQPTRKPAPTGSRLDLFQAVTAGDLFRLHLLDERQYADLPPCRDEGTNSVTDYGDCEAREDDRTRLGSDQESWLNASLEKGGVTWNILGNPVVLAGVDGGTDKPMYYLDTWDGFPDARRRLIAALAKVDNPVVLTGDYHAGMTLEVRAEPFDQESELVATEFMSPPISSSLFSADMSARTPQMLEQINAHGYITVEVTPAKLTVDFRCLDDVTKADSAIKTYSSWSVRAGNPEPQKA